MSEEQKPAGDGVDVGQLVSEEQWHIENAKIDIAQFMVGVEHGAPVPDAEVFTPEGDAVSLAAHWADKPALIVTGSMTCPPSRKLNPATSEILKEFGDRLNVAVLYVLDAHPSGDTCPYTGTDWVTKTNREEGILIRQPRDQDERNGRAREYRDALDLKAAVLVDNMDNLGWAAVGKAPNIAVLVGEDGKCRLCQDWFRPEALREQLASLLSD